MAKYMVVRHEAHTSLTAAISADVTSGQAVKVTGAKTIGPAAAGDLIAGVVHHTKTAASGETVSFRLKGDVIPMKAGGAIAAGDKLEAGAAGTVVKQTTGALAGVAWTAAANGAEVLVIVL
jgi:hypothetical protein